jgi:hypothetical protein
VGQVSYLWWVRRLRYSGSAQATEAQRTFWLEDGIPLRGTEASPKTVEATAYPLNKDGRAVFPAPVPQGSQDPGPLGHRFGAKPTSCSFDILYFHTVRGLRRYVLRGKVFLYNGTQWK